MKLRLIGLALCALLLLPTSVYAAIDLPDIPTPQASIAPKGEASTEETTGFALVHTGDVRGQVEQTDKSIGFPLLYAFVSDIMQTSPVLLVDAGNALQGGFAQQDNGAAMIGAMNAMGYAAMGLGVEDVALGIDRLQALGQNAKFPILCANLLREDGTMLFDPYVIIEIAGKRVGIMSLISPDVLKKYPEQTKGLVAYEPHTIANMYIDQMRENQVDYIIALTSLGVETESSVGDFAAATNGISVVVDSGADKVLPDGELNQTTNTIYFNVEPAMERVGVAQITFIDNLTYVNPLVCTLEQVKKLTPSAEMQAFIDDPTTEINTDYVGDSGIWTGFEGSSESPNAGKLTDDQILYICLGVTGVLLLIGGAIFYFLYWRKKKQVK